MNNKVISPKEWAQKNELTIDQIELIQEACSVISHWRGSLIGKTCVICDKLLDNEDLRALQLHHFNATCSAHRIVKYEGNEVEVATVFQIEKIRIALGYPAETDYSNGLL